MSLHEKCIQCKDVPITPEQIFKSLVRVDADGNFYVPLKFNLCAESDELAVQCNASDWTWEQLLRALIVIDDCGHCAIKVSVDAGAIDMLCEECDDRQQQL
jgi:hypothetical protein